MCNKLSDSFSLGCIVAQLVMGEPVFFKCRRGSCYKQLMIRQYQEVLFPISPPAGQIDFPPYDELIFLTHKDYETHAGKDYTRFIEGPCSLQVCH